MQGILVVEDDPLVAEVIQATLDDTYAITVVANAADALAAIHNATFSLMLLDCTLPGGMDPALVPDADRAGVRVVLMSGDPERAAAVAEAPRRFIVKPFSLTTLLDTVESELDQGV